MNSFKLSLIAATTAVLLTSTAIADDDKNKPKMMYDMSWATFSGKVTEVNADSFVLDYGEGTLIVEVDDGDFDNDAYKFFEGDEVTVTGRIDHNLFANTTLEAGSIYVKGLNTTFFSSALDEEDISTTYYTSYVPMVSDTVTIVGEIESTSTMLNEVEIKYGDITVDVDLSELDYNPLDNEGWMKLEEGDLVKVTGSFDEDFFNDYDLFANRIVLIDS